MRNSAETKERLVYPVRLNDWVVVLEGEIPAGSHHDLTHPYLQVRWFKSPDPDFPDKFSAYLDSKAKEPQPAPIRKEEPIKEWEGALSFSWFREPDYYAYREWQREYNRETTTLYQEKTMVVTTPAIYEPKSGWDIFILAKHRACYIGGFRPFGGRLEYPDLGVSRFYLPDVTTGKMHWRHPFYLPFDTPERDVTTALKGINLILNTELSHKSETGGTARVIPD